LYIGNMKRVAFIDLGTNSCKLNIVEITLKDGLTKEIAKFKEVVRLGTGGFDTNYLLEDAINRTIEVLKQFFVIASNYKVDDIYAVATAAVREAENQAEFIKRVKAEANIDMQVVSGVREAYLIYLGVSRNVNIDERAMFVDVGGGTTELVVGDCEKEEYLDSAKLGAIRIYDMFFKDHTEAVSKEKYNEVLDYVKSTTNYSTKCIREAGFDVCYGSSGTATNLGEITLKRIDPDNVSYTDYEVSYKDLKDTIDILCSLPQNERKHVVGLKSDRVDIIIAGAVILDGILQSVGAESLRITDYSLKEGLVVDYIQSALA